MIRTPISTAEAAAILGVTRRHVQHLVATGQLPGTPVGQRGIVLERRAVEQYRRKPRGRRRGS